MLIAKIGIYFSPPKNPKCIYKFSDNFNDSRHFGCVVQGNMGNFKYTTVTLSWEKSIEK